MKKFLSTLALMGILFGFSACTIGDNSSAVQQSAQQSIQSIIKTPEQIEREYTFSNFKVKQFLFNEYEKYDGDFHVAYGYSKVQTYSSFDQFKAAKLDLNYTEEFFKTNDLAVFGTCGSSSNNFTFGELLEKDKVLTPLFYRDKDTGISTDDILMNLCCVEIPKDSGYTMGEIVYQERSGQKYKLSVTITMPSNFVMLSTSDQYIKGGTQITIWVERATDVGNYIFLNDRPVYNGIYGETHDDWFIFTMPEKDSTLVITHDQFYRDINYTFQDTEYWAKEITIDNVKGVQYEHGYVGVAPGVNDPVVKSSEKKADIEKFVTWFNGISMQKSKSNDAVGGGAYTTITFILQNGEEYEVTIHGNRYLWYDFSSFQYFDVNGDIPSL